MDKDTERPFKRISRFLRLGGIIGHSGAIIQDTPWVVHAKFKNNIARRMIQFSVLGFWGKNTIYTGIIALWPFRDYQDLGFQARNRALCLLVQFYSQSGQSFFNLRN